MSIWHGRLTALLWNIVLNLIGAILPAVILFGVDLGLGDTVRHGVMGHQGKQKGSPYHMEGHGSGHYSLLHQLALKAVTLPV